MEKTVKTGLQAALFIARQMDSAVTARGLENARECVLEARRRRAVHAAIRDLAPRRIEGQTTITLDVA